MQEENSKYTAHITILPKYNLIMLMYFFFKENEWNRSMVFFWTAGFFYK